MRLVGGAERSGSRYRIKVSLPIPGGSLNLAEFEALGLLRVWGAASGWEALVPRIQVSTAQRHVQANSAYGLFPLADRSFMLEFAVRREELPCRLLLDGAQLLEVGAEAAELPPWAGAYEDLLSTDQVLHRDRIYGYGPPADAYNPEILELACHMQAPILDFGCGAGPYLRALRARGLAAQGVEIEGPRISGALKDDVRPYVHLYDGSFPLPFETGQFNGVLATEVVEHIPDYETALAELARVTRKHLVLSVPDMASIPLCAGHHVVPWHLLESTHVNFFTANSLHKALRRHFSDVRLYRSANFTVNGSFVPGSLAATCEK